MIVTHNIEEAVFLGQRILVLGRPPNQSLRIIDNPAAGLPTTAIARLLGKMRRSCAERWHEAQRYERGDAAT